MAMPISGEMANGPCKSARAGRPDFRLLHSLHSVKCCVDSQSMLAGCLRSRQWQSAHPLPIENWREDVSAAVKQVRLVRILRLAGR